MAVGNFNIDIVLYTEIVPQAGTTVIARELQIRPGGAALNYSITVAQYGHTAYLVAKASTHEIVKGVFEEVKQYGVRLDYVKFVEGSPGVVLIIVDKNGERTMIKHPGVNEQLSPSDLNSDLLREAQIIHIASVKPEIAMEISEIASRKGVLVSLDPGGYMSEWRVEEFLKTLRDVHILYINEQDLCTHLRNMSLDKIFKYGLSILVVKRGKKGAVVLTQGSCYSGYAEPIKRPIDTTGAGDAFDALFNAKYLESKDLGLSLVHGLAAGALKTGFRGSFMPWNPKLYALQLEKVIVKHSNCSEVIFCTGN